jgi:histidine triad (HIT) family protein
VSDAGYDFASSCTFCRLVRGESAVSKVLEDDLCLAFLDHRPVFFGHTLLIPKVHYTTLADLPATLFTPLLTNVQLLARAMELGLQAEGAFIALNYRISQSVPHVHWHILPRRHGDGLHGFLWPRQHYRDEAHLHEVGEQLSIAVGQLHSGLAR